MQKSRRKDQKRSARAAHVQRKQIYAGISKLETVACEESEKGSAKADRNGLCSKEASLCRRAKLEVDACRGVGKRTEKAGRSGSCAKKACLCAVQSES